MAQYKDPQPTPHTRNVRNAAPSFVPSFIKMNSQVGIVNRRSLCYVKPNSDPYHYKWEIFNKMCRLLQLPVVMTVYNHASTSLTKA